LTRYRPFFLLLLLSLFSLLLPLSLSAALAQYAGQDVALAGSPHQHEHSAAARWEGSPAGIAFSEFNHHFSAIFILVMGGAELLGAFGIPVGLLMPAAMFLSGVYLLIWSDHDAWPIGSLSVVQTFLGGDSEMAQHKLFGVLSLYVGIMEGVRRIGWLQHPGWRIPLPAFAILGGALLLLHSHGAHPDVHKIALQHMVMGGMAVAAGISKFAADWKQAAHATTRKRWGVMWSAFIMLIGLQLLIYSE
jgi:hypothetical protein